MKNEEFDPVVQAREVLKVEADSILNLIPRIDGNFSEAVETIYHSKGRVIVSGIGKSGLVGRKIVATLTSTGTPALFLHPVEGLHGDLGIVTRDDVMLAISNSGETHELNMIIATVRDIGASLIAFTGNLQSTLARCSDIIIDVGVEKEACPFGLAPTSSSTATLAMGDALAVALIKKRHFTDKDFFKFHPGGTLGQRLQAKVRDTMTGLERIPHVYAKMPAMHAIETIDEKNLGFAIVTDRENHLLGILTDGDVRRFVRQGINFQEVAIDDLMTLNPRTIDADASLALAVEIMEKNEITTLVVVDSEKHLLGYIHLHDILGRGGTVKIAVQR